MGLLDGRRAAVTGGGSGIGRATCERFVAEGARVAVVDVDVDAATAVAGALGDSARAFAADVTERSALDGALREAAAWMGGLDTLCNNAGAGSLSPLHRYGDDEWQRLIAVNLTGVFNGLQAGIPLLREAGGGAIVNVGSAAATVRPTPGEAPYLAAKAAVASLSRSAALENAPAIRVNTVSPGMIDTPLTSFLMGDERAVAMIETGTPMRRAGTADEVASVITFLCSDLASYVTGQDLVVDGGAGLPLPQIHDFLSSIITSLDR